MANGVDAYTSMFEATWIHHLPGQGAVARYKHDRLTRRCPTSLGSLAFRQRLLGYGYRSGPKCGGGKYLWDESYCWRYVTRLLTALRQQRGRFLERQPTRRNTIRSSHSPNGTSSTNGMREGSTQTFTVRILHGVTLGLHLAPLTPAHPGPDEADSVRNQSQGKHRHSGSAELSRRIVEEADAARDRRTPEPITGMTRGTRQPGLARTFPTATRSWRTYLKVETMAQSWTAADTTAFAATLDKAGSAAALAECGWHRAGERMDC